ncbi:MAG: 30S ribosomal protein S5 [Nanoarchaeota archaeon]
MADEQEHVKTENQSEELTTQTDEEQEEEHDDYSEPLPVIEETEEPEEVEDVEKPTTTTVSDAPEGWNPKTETGRKVKSGVITEIDEILDRGEKILEPEVVSTLLPDLEIDLLAIGQSKGKFGGGQRRVFRQTQKKTKEGNKPKFSAFAICGNYNGYVGYGYGKTKETVPAREKAFRNCKLNVFKIRRGCSSWDCTCGNPHTIPFRVTGKCGSVEVTLMPAPKGTGLCVEKETGKILKLSGIKDVWSKTRGKTSSKINHIKACLAALKKLTTTKIRPHDIKSLNITEGKTKITQES